MATSALDAGAFADPHAYAEAFSQFVASDARLAEFRGHRADNLEASFSHGLQLQRILFDEGWSRLGWPEECGGLGGSPLLRAALFDVLTNHAVTIPEQYTSLETLAPVLVVHAPHLAASYFPGMLAGEESWCQAFSEPDAGSDLASLRTRMEPDGDGWRISGQKVWSSYAHLAQRSVLLARTGEPGHRGLTMVLLDLDQPGVTVRPTRAEDGENHFGEIFLDEAHLPADRIIGDVGKGWSMAMYMLQWERGAWGWQQQGRFHHRLEIALALGGDSAGDASASIGRAYTALTALRLHTLRTVRRLARDESLGPEVSIDKLVLVDAELAVWDAIRSVVQPGLELDGELEWLREEFLFSRAAPIYGGSQDIQRTLVAQRVLGLPREP
jgi:alkylation response protein AidB-like acyl-CoA dehydrogenase